MAQAVAFPAAQTPSDTPRLSVRDNWWIVIPIAALVYALQNHVLWFLNYIRVVAVQALLQFTIIFIMAHFATGV
jgi:hypothetical protein